MVDEKLIRDAAIAAARFGLAEEKKSTRYHREKDKKKRRHKQAKEGVERKYKRKREGAEHAYKRERGEHVSATFGKVGGVLGSLAANAYARRKGRKGRIDTRPLIAEAVISGVGGAYRAHRRRKHALEDYGRAKERALDDLNYNHRKEKSEHARHRNEESQDTWAPARLAAEGAMWAMGRRR